MNYLNIQNDDLRNAMNTTYKNNMEFFKIINPNLFYKLSRDIKEVNFTLEFKDGDFNIFDKLNNSYLYKTSLENYSKEALKTTKTVKEATIVDLTPSVYNIKNPNSQRLFNDDIGSYSNFQICNDVFNFRKLFNHFKIQDKNNLNNIPTFIFFGTLLGCHLIDIHKVIKAKSYMVVEPNLEIFRLSLFMTDYRKIAIDSDILFCIDENHIETIKQYEVFINGNYLDSYIYKYYSTSIHDIKIIHQFNLALENRSAMAYDHYRQLHYLKHSSKNIKKYRLLNQNNSPFSLSNKPTIVLSPGPSLRDNAKWIKKNQDKFIIVSFGATIKILSEIGVKPDIIISIDASTLILNQFPETCKNTYKDAITVLATNTHPEVFKKFKKKNIFLYESNFKLTTNGIDEAPAITVGENTMHILLSLGFTNIYLLGTDLSIDINTGSGYDKSHWQGNVKHNVSDYKKNIKKVTNEIELSSNYIPTKANLADDTILSSNLFLTIIKHYEMMLSHHRLTKYFSVYNLSSGAFIPQTIPFFIKDLKNLTKIKNKNNTLKTAFNNKSSLGFCQNDLENYQNETIFTKELIDDINEFNNQNINSFEEFDNFSRMLSNKIINYNQNSYSYSLYAMTFGYMKIVNNYINYYFNDKELVLSLSLLQKIKTLWCKQILKILLEYVKILKNIK